MPRRAAKIDANQAAIVRGLRARGVSVQSLAAVGGGVPDVICGWRGYNILLEIKDGAKAPSKRRLTDLQQTWAHLWRGQHAVVKNLQEAIDAIIKVAG